MLYNSLIGLHCLCFDSTQLTIRFFSILSHHTLELGKIHIDGAGAKVFCTNIVRREFAQVQCPPTTGGVKELYVQYEYYYMTQIIHYQQELREVRKQVSCV